jgi:hypothetical protein
MYSRLRRQGWKLGMVRVAAGGTKYFKALAG